MMLPDEQRTSGQVLVVSVGSSYWFCSRYFHLRWALWTVDLQCFFFVSVALVIVLLMMIENGIGIAVSPVQELSSAILGFPPLARAMFKISWERGKMCVHLFQANKHPFAVSISLCVCVCSVLCMFCHLEPDTLRYVVVNTI